jgi:hypothetical protein
MAITTDSSFKRKAVLVRLSAIEHKRVHEEAARRGMTASDLARSLLRLATGTLAVHTTLHESGGGGVEG